jgi:hypothetical protein
MLSVFEPLIGGASYQCPYFPQCIDPPELSTRRLEVLNIGDPEN